MMRTCMCVITYFGVNSVGSSKVVVHQIYRAISLYNFFVTRIQSWKLRIHIPIHTHTHTHPDTSLKHKTFYNSVPMSHSDETDTSAHFIFVSYFKLENYWGTNWKQNYMKISWFIFVQSWDRCMLCNWQVKLPQYKLY